MSTSSGNATKGEKGKKFQSLKINLCTANKPTEPEQQQQHRSSIQRKQHGMTSLGRVPTARRPTNLPSEKAEHGGNDLSVNLVPSGGPGWGNKQSESGPTTTPSLNQNPPTNAPMNNVTTTGTSQQVPHAQLYPPTSRMPPLPTQMGGHAPVHHGHTDVKTWAMMTHSGDSLAPNFLTPQSPLFQHEFPSLSSNSETSSAATPVTATATQKPTANTTVDTQYGPGPSLRPQTEGSWIQGGSRPQNSMGPATGSQSATAPAQARPMGTYPPPPGPDGARNNLGPSGVGVAQAGPPYSSSVPPQQNIIPPHFTGMMPSFMLRNSYPSGNFTPSFAAGPMKGVTGPHPPYLPLSDPHSSAERYVQPGANVNSNKRTYDDEDVRIRPIVKEEDLNHMASIGNDVGWAASEDIDYNQKLSFSDDEDDEKSKISGKGRLRTQSVFKSSDKSLDKKDTFDKESDLKNSKENLKGGEKVYFMDPRNPEMKNVWNMRRTIMSPAAPSTALYQIPAANGRFEEDDEAWQEKRRQKKEEMDIIIQRANKRKEEEEKRFNEQQQAANLKLKKLEAAMEANQYGNKENKIPLSNERNLDMLPSWEKDKYPPPVSVGEELKKSHASAPVPVVKDASEFRELTQLVDKNFVKKELKERENVQQVGFSRTSLAPRFQNRPSNGASSGPIRCIMSQNTQFSSKTTTISIPRLHRSSETDSHSEKDRDRKIEDGRKERDIDRYGKESFQERDYSYNHSHDQSNDLEYSKEYELKSKYYNDKDDNLAESYGSNNFDRESSYNLKTERKNSDSEKSKNYDVRRYSENENHEKDERYELEKPRHLSNTTSRLNYPTYPEGDNPERKRSREEVLNFDKKYKKKDSSLREKENETFSSYKKEVDLKRDYEHGPLKDERKSPSTYEERLTRNEHFHRESKESLRDEPFSIQDSRYSWTEDADIEDRKPRKDHFREDRGDRYSHAQRHVPRPITRAKLEAKELESDSKGVNLTPLVRSDKKAAEIKKNDSNEIVMKDRDKTEKSPKTEDSGPSGRDSETQIEVPSAWKRDDKQKLKDESKTTQSSASVNEHNDVRNDDGKMKAEKKEIPATKASSKDDQGDKSSEEKMAAKERRKLDQRIKDQRNWTRYGSYQGGNSYAGNRPNPKLRRPSNRGISSKGNSRRGDSKYSESEYSDEVSVGSGREDRNSHSERDKNRPSKSKRYDRDDRNDYRMDDRDYGARSRSNRDYYYKPAPRGRNSSFRPAVGVSKRMDGYGPPSRNPFGGTGSEEKRLSKSNKDSSNMSEQNAAEKKCESNKTSKNVDRSWKKNVESQTENKTLSSSASTQAADANEESFATASEGSDSEDGCGEVQKAKSAYGTTKRSPAVVATKQPRKYRSTSRRRNYENRRSGASYPRKDSGSYSTSSKRNAPPSSSGKSSTKKESEKYDDGAAISSSRDDLKASDKQTRDFMNGPNKKGIKPRTHSGSRKNTTNTRPISGPTNINRKNSDVPPRMQSKSKTDGKHMDYRDFKNADTLSMHGRDVGHPVPAPPPSGNAWDKPLTGALRTGSPSTHRPAGSNSGVTTSVIGQEKSLGQITDHRPDSSALSLDQSTNSGASEKVKTMVLENLDGSTPPVQTIIFENTNFKSSPGDMSTKAKYGGQLKNHRFEKDSKLDCIDSSVSSFGHESSELANNKHESLQMALFNKNEDVNDMKLDFNFDSTEFSKLADDSNKSGKGAIELSHAMNIDAELNSKIAAVKKVWDGSLVEHYDDKYDTGMTNASISFSPSFSTHGSDPNNVPSCYSHVDSSGHVQVDDVSGLSHAEVVFNPQLQGVNYGSSNCQTVVIKNDSGGSSSNVCKVKPQPQGCGANIINAAQSSVISTTLVSQPPPMSSPSYTFSCSTPQPNLSNGNVAVPTITFPPSFNVPPMPSSPVLFNSSQTAPQTPGLYPTFQIDNPQVAARSTFGQYSTTYGLSNPAALGQTAAPFNQGQPMYLPNAPPPELYSQQIPFRLQSQPFGNTQQITSPNTVLISSSSNSLMSPSIKPTSQGISAIGTKAAGFAATQTSPQVYMAYDAAATTLLANQSFIPNNPILQRQASNVVAAGTLSAASNSFYSSASGAGQTGFYPGTNSALQQQTGAIGLTAFTQSANQSLAPMQNFNSQLTQQQYRSAQQSYMKSGGNTAALANEFANSKTITIPNHDVMNPGFPPTNKRLQSGNKNLQGVPPQGIAQHSMSQNAYSYQASNQMRNNGSANKASQYPHPIQRPVSQGNTNSSNRTNGGGNNSGNTSAAHRMPVRNNSHQLANNIQQPPSFANYSTSSAYGSSKLDASSLDSKSESGADAKLADNMKTLSAKSTSSEKNGTSNEQ